MTTALDGPLPTDPLGKADRQEVARYVSMMIADDATEARITRDAWSRPGLVAQAVIELMARLADTRGYEKQLRAVQRERDRLQAQLAKQQQVLDVQARRLSGGAR